MNIEPIFENEHFLIVNKPAGLVVNRSQTIFEDTLQDWAASFFRLKSGDLGIGDRAGIVHRLDRETSGLLVVAKNQKTFDFLQKQFRDRGVKKEYSALVHFHLKSDTGLLMGNIGRVGKFGKFGVVTNGRESVTEYEVIKRCEFRSEKFDKLILGLKITKPRLNYYQKQARQYTLLKIRLMTGRTHQIRVHLKNLGHPIVSDKIYAPSKILKFDTLWCPRLFLHAAHIEFLDPKSKKTVGFESGLPNELKNAMLNLL